MRRRCLTCRVLIATGSYCATCRPRNGSTWAWRALRLRALDRDRGLCVVCGDVATEVDHIVPVELGGGDGLDNLRSLCSDCHAGVHSPLPTAA
jgi:5-methylcytosine-specific restriction endonuclease McrA